MDFMGGGELFTHLQDKKMLREDAVRLYAAEMVLAIENLHSMDIIHRWELWPGRWPIVVCSVFMLVPGLQRLEARKCPSG
jgi:hypothetical protein